MAVKVRVLVADDSALMRRTLRRIIEEDGDLEVVDTARDGEDVVRKTIDLRPDVVSMDINMPKLDGISALQIILSKDICPVVMVSSLTQAGAVTTYEALALGAFDIVGKPQGTVGDLGSVGRELRIKLRAAALSDPVARARRARMRKPSVPPVSPRASTPPHERCASATTNARTAVAMGISTGGPSTIAQILPQLRANTHTTFFLVQHMPPTFTSTFARRLDEICELKVLEAEAGMEVEAGHCYVARGDLHMTVHKSPAGRIVLRTPTMPESLFRPSVDVMMASVLAMFGKNTLGVLMTGIGDDGAEQMVRIRASGGYTIAESAESAVVFGMPREAIERGGACEVQPCWDIAAAIQRRLA